MAVVLDKLLYENADRLLAENGTDLLCTESTELTTLDTTEALSATMVAARIGGFNRAQGAPDVSLNTAESVSRIGGFKRVQNGLGGNPDNPSTSESVTATKNVFRTASESLSVGGLRFTDNFNRADGGMGANWVTDTSLNHPLAIVSNTCQGSTAATHNIATYNASGVLPANQYAQCKVAVIGGYVGTVLRSDTAGNFYVCYYPPSLGNSCTIYRF